MRGFYRSWRANSDQSNLGHHSHILWNFGYKKRFGMSGHGEYLPIGMKLVANLELAASNRKSLPPSR